MKLKIKFVVSACAFDNRKFRGGKRVASRSGEREFGES